MFVEKNISRKICWRTQKLIKWIWNYWKLRSLSCTFNTYFHLGIPGESVLLSHSHTSPRLPSRLPFLIAGSTCLYVSPLWGYSFHQSSHSTSAVRLKRKSLWFSGSHILGASESLGRVVKTDLWVPNYCQNLDSLCINAKQKYRNRVIEGRKEWFYYIIRQRGNTVGLKNCVHLTGEQGEVIKSGKSM